MDFESNLKEILEKGLENVENKVKTDFYKYKMMFINQ